jgi:uracil-DNA glycosylase
MDTAARHRLLLSLRSEQAMGLHSIPKGSGDLDVSLTPPMVQDEPAVVPSSDRPTRESFPGSAVNLFGQPATPQPAAVPINPPGTSPFDAPLLSTDEKRQRLAAMEEKEVRTCQKCRLCETRTHTVFGEGNPDTQIFFIGEGPGENEDLSGRPFVGRAGQLLDKMIAAMGLRREQVFIANIVKCRPPGNRVPAPDEVATCTPYLERQLEIIRPPVIVTLGRPAATYMLSNPKLTMGSIRGRWQQWRGIKLMPTFHPSYVLRTYTEEIRKTVWGDLKQVMEAVGLPAPSRGKSM